jgi:YVTN family beta-propeller protein
MLRSILLLGRGLPAIALLLAGSSTALAAPFAYVADRVGGVVSVIDRATHTVVKTIEVGPAPVATAVHPDGGTVYVTVGPLRAMAVIDAATNTVVRRIDVGDNPTGIDISRDGSTVCVVNTADRTVSIIDTASLSVSATVPVANHPFAVVIHPDGRTVYVAGDYPGGVSVIDAATHTVARTVSIGTSLGGMAFHPDGSRLYVADSSHDTLVVLDTATLQTIRSVPVGRIPLGVAVHPDGSAVYVTNVLDEGFVSVVDTGSYTVIDTIKFPAPIQPQGIAVDPRGSYLYAVSRGLGLVLVIATRTRSVVGLIGGIGSEPTGLGPFMGPASAETAAAFDDGVKHSPSPPASVTSLVRRKARPLLRGAPASAATAVSIDLMPAARITPGDDMIYVRDDCLWLKDLSTGKDTPVTGRPDPLHPEIPICDDPRFRPLKHAAVNAARDRIVFVAGEENTLPIETKIFLIELNSRTAFQLVPGFVRAGYGGVDFSPAGDIYFCGVPAGDPERPEAVEDSEVYRVTADLSRWQQVTNIPNRGVADLSVSGDGTKLAFGAMVLSTGNVEIAEANIDGTNVRVAIQGGRLWYNSVHDPEHSPDTSEIVYSRIRLLDPDGSACRPNGGNYCQDLYRQHIGGTPTRMSRIGDTSVVPDWKGTTILYHLRRGPAAEPGSWNGTVVMNEDGTGATAVATEAVFAKFIPAVAPR